MKYLSKTTSVRLKPFFDVTIVNLTPTELQDLCTAIAEVFTPYQEEINNRLSHTAYRTRVDWSKTDFAPNHAKYELNHSINIAFDGDNKFESFLTALANSLSANHPALIRPEPIEIDPSRLVIPREFLGGRVVTNIQLSQNPETPITLDTPWYDLVIILDKQRRADKQRVQNVRWDEQPYKTVGDALLYFQITPSAFTSFKEVRNVGELGMLQLQENIHFVLKNVVGVEPCANEPSKLSAADNFWVKYCNHEAARTFNGGLSI